MISVIFSKKVVLIILIISLKLWADFVVPSELNFVILNKNNYTDVYYSFVYNMRDNYIDKNFIDCYKDRSSIISYLKQNQWVKSFKIHCFLSGSMNIEIVEFSPYFIWFNGKEYHLVSTEGTIIESSSFLRNFLYPLVKSSEKPDDFNVIQKILDSFPNLLFLVISYTRSDFGWWTIHTALNLDILLPHNDYGSIEKSLRWVEDHHRKYKILFLPASTIDMRNTDRISIGVRD